METTPVMRSDCYPTQGLAGPRKSRLNWNRVVSVSGTRRHRLASVDPPLGGTRARNWMGHGHRSDGTDDVSQPMLTEVDLSNVEAGLGQQVDVADAFAL